MKPSPRADQEREVMAAPRWHSGMPASYLPETRPVFLLAADAGLAELDNLELAILERDDEAGVLGVEAEGDDGLVRGAARVGLDEETVEEAKGGVVGVALGGAVGDGVAKRAGGGATSEDVHAADVRPEQHVLGRGVQAKEAHARARHGAYRVGVDETLERVEGKGRGRASVAGGGLNLGRSRHAGHSRSVAGGKMRHARAPSRNNRRPRPP